MCKKYAFILCTDLLTSHISLSMSHMPHVTCHMSHVPRSHVPMSHRLTPSLKLNSFFYLLNMYNIYNITILITLYFVFLHCITFILYCYLIIDYFSCTFAMSFMNSENQSVSDNRCLKVVWRHFCGKYRAANFSRH